MIDQLQARRERPHRQAPPHRPAKGAPRPPAVGTPPATDIEPLKIERPVQERPSPAAGRARAGTSSGDEKGRGKGEKAKPVGTEPSSGSERLRLAPEEASANFAVRVRRTLDDLVAWRLAELRRQGVRSSKVELTEMLLWEASDADVDELAHRLSVFRSYAPR